MKIEQAVYIKKGLKTIDVEKLRITQISIL